MNKARIPAVLAVAATCVSCSRWDLPVEIPFHATWKGAPIACEGTVPLLTDLRFYVMNPRLIDVDGQEHDVRFATEFEWENDAVAFIDLESGAGACAHGTPETYDRVIGVARAGEYRGLRFTVGVPFRLNHADPRIAAPPLDRSDMYWRSLAGYRFLRAGVGSDRGTFEIHVGSSGCNGSVGYVTECKFPNRIEVFLPEFVVGDSVAVNLDVLLAAGVLQDGELLCSAETEDAACSAAFAALGLDAANGLATGAQRVFATEETP